MEEVELVHGGDGGDEHSSQGTSRGCGGLNGAILLGTEESTTELLGESLLHDLDDRVTENGTEEGSTEGETGLETKVNVGSGDDATEDGTDEEGTNGKLGGLLGKKCSSNCLPE